MNKGKFIVIEGIDGCGKGTLVSKMQEEYKDFVYLREPGGTEVGEEIRSVLLNPYTVMSDLTEAYLYASARAEISTKIRDLLNEGKTVVCERFVYSSYAYQGLKLGYDTVESINKEAIKGLKPDLIVHLVGTPQSLFERVMNRGELDRIEVRGQKYLDEVSESYDKVFSREMSKNKVKVLKIDTENNNPDEVFEKAKSTFNKLNIK